MGAPVRQLCQHEADAHDEGSEPKHGDRVARPHDGTESDSISVPPTMMAMT
jgi:hypothetical protein